MPNHIKNRITFNAPEAKVMEVLNAFGTKVPASLSKTQWGEEKVICEKEGEYGWFSLSTGVFSRRNQDDVIGLPEGYEMNIDQGFFKFPDFKKAIPQPAIYDEIGEVNGSLVNHAKNRAFAPCHSHPLIAGLEALNRKSTSKETLSEEDNKKVDLMVKAYHEHGHVYWYEWNSDKWGTKWGAYNCERIGFKCFEFDTAWSSAVKATDAIHEVFPDVPFVLEYADEDTGSNCGRLTYDGGKRTDYLPQSGTNEAYELAFLLRPHYADDYKLIEGEYRYFEEE